MNTWNIQNFSNCSEWSASLKFSTTSSSLTALQPTNLSSKLIQLAKQYAVYSSRNKVNIQAHWPTIIHSAWVKKSRMHSTPSDRKSKVLKMAANSFRENTDSKAHSLSTITSPMLVSYSKLMEKITFTPTRSKRIMWQISRARCYVNGAKAAILIQTVKISILS